MQKERERERSDWLHTAQRSVGAAETSQVKSKTKQTEAKKSKKREGQNNIERAFDTNNYSDCDSDANAICSCRCRRLACHGIGEPASRQGFPLRRQLAVVPQHSKAADVSSGKQQAVRGNCKAEQQRRTEIKTQLKHKETQQSKLNSTKAKATLQRKLNKGNSSKETQLRQLNKQNKLNSVRGKETAKERESERERE